MGVSACDVVLVCLCLTFVCVWLVCVCRSCVFLVSLLCRSRVCLVNLGSRVIGYAHIQPPVILRMLNGERCLDTV